MSKASGQLKLGGGAHQAPPLCSKEHDDVCTTAKKITEESGLGCLGAISHVVCVLDLSGDGVDIGSFEYITLLLLIQ